jgi:AcrR family transcriptional regulator
MDRRQRKTREAIFKAFVELLSKKNYSEITVGQIIEKADVGRATFYSHFETKDTLLKSLCEELFCHIFDSLRVPESSHRHIFDCDSQESVFLHLFRHLEKNDNGILDLIYSDNNELFLKYFKDSLKNLVYSQRELFEGSSLPESLIVNHISVSFVEAVRWWVKNGRKETPEEMTSYFYILIKNKRM